jgi:hypothetical protein
MGKDAAEFEGILALAHLVSTGEPRLNEHVGDDASTSK